MHIPEANCVSTERTCNTEDIIYKIAIKLTDTNDNSIIKYYVGTHAIMHHAKILQLYSLSRDRNKGHAEKLTDYAWKLKRMGPKLEYCTDFQPIHRYH